MSNRSAICILLAATFFSIYAKPNVPKLAHLYKVDFKKSMSKNENYDPLFAEKSTDWQLLETLYNDYCNTLTISQKPRIPKIIHIIWLGSRLPLRCRKLLESWKMKHPDWQIRIWTDKDVKPFELKNQPFYDMAVNWGEKSDIFRYEILYRYGGLYIDTDFKCLNRSFDIFHHTCDFYTGIAYNKTALLYNGLIGCAPGHPIMKACIDTMKFWGEPNNFETIMQRTGPDFFTRTFFNEISKCPKNSVVAFPTAYFYPLPGKKRQFAQYEHFVKRFIQPESYAIHYFAASWAH